MVSPEKSDSDVSELTVIQIKIIFFLSINGKLLGEKIGFFYSLFFRITSKIRRYEKITSKTIRLYPVITQ